jgi:diguanylate cyclase (GGDEF)-like protein
VRPVIRVEEPAPGLKLSGPGTSRLCERRPAREVRVQLPLDVAAGLPIRFRDPSPSTGRLIDVSRSGLRLAAPEAPRVGQRLALEVAPGGATAPEIEAVVRWWRCGPDGAGDGGLRVVPNSLVAWHDVLKRHVAPRITTPEAVLQPSSSRLARVIVLVGPDADASEQLAVSLRATGLTPELSVEWPEVGESAAPVVVVAGPYGTAQEAEPVCVRGGDWPASDAPPLIVVVPGADRVARRALLEAGAFDCVTTLDNDDLEMRLLVALRVARQRQALQETIDRLTEVSARDPLTGLFNRRNFFALANAECDRVRRAGGSLALLLLDIDHFKQVNDLYGHQAGDRILHTFARVLQRQLRPFDVVGRYGGEEFVVLLPGTDARGAAAAAERLRTAMVGSAFDEQGVVRLTISIGVVAAGRGHVPPLSTLVASADRALYRAKQSGRNRVEPGVLAEPSAAST